MLYVDGWVANAGSGVGLIVASPKRHSYEHTLKFTFNMSKNEAGYEALLAGMEICNALGVAYLKAFSNSQLVVSEVKDELEAHDPSMAAYLAKVNEKSSMFQRFKIEHVPRSKNQQADALLKLTNSFPVGCPKNIHWEILSKWMIDTKELVCIDRSKTWMEPLTSYLCD